MSECKGCGIEKDSKHYGKIFLTKDGYCSVCNNKHKDRERPKGFFEFKTTKKGEYDHLTHMGSKRTKDYDKKQELYNSAKSGGIIAAGYEYKKYKKSKDKSILDYVRET